MNLSRVWRRWFLNINQLSWALLPSKALSHSALSSRSLKRPKPVLWKSRVMTGISKENCPALPHSNLHGWMSMTRRISPETLLALRESGLQYSWDTERKSPGLFHANLEGWTNPASYFQGCSRLACCHQRKSRHWRVKKCSAILPTHKPSSSKCPGLWMILYPDLVSAGLPTAQEKKQSGIGPLLAPSCLHISNIKLIPLRCEWLCS